MLNGVKQRVRPGFQSLFTLSPHIVDHMHLSRYIDYNKKPDRKGEGACFAIQEIAEYGSLLLPLRTDKLTCTNKSRLREVECPFLVNFI